MMSSSETPVPTANDPSRARHEASVRVPARRTRYMERGEGTTRAPEVAATSARAAWRLVMLLHATPLFGVAGAITLYWSSDGPRDVLFAVGIFLLQLAVTVFHHVRARLIARLELPLLQQGVPALQARERALLEVDKLIRASLRFEGRSGVAKWPPIALG